MCGLEKELDLKTKEFRTLCDKLEELKKLKVDPNDKRLLKVLDLFKEKQNEINEVKRQLEELK